MAVIRHHSADGRMQFTNTLVMARHNQPSCMGNARTLMMHHDAQGMPPPATAITSLDQAALMQACKAFCR
jgi:hypothetical protein